MSFTGLEGQRSPRSRDHNCSFCQNPRDETMIGCVVCHKILHQNCAIVTDNDVFKCPQCSAIRPNSPAQSVTSSDSTRSHLSQSRKIQLQLQRLEEEHKIQTDYLKKKYQLLEEAEAFFPDKSHSVTEWIACTKSQPDNDHTANNANKNNSQFLLPEQSTHRDTESEAKKPTNNFEAEASCCNLNTTCKTVPLPMNNGTVRTTIAPNCTSNVSTQSNCNQQPLPVTIHSSSTAPALLSTNNESHNINSNSTTHCPHNSAPRSFTPQYPISSTINSMPNAQINPSSCLQNTATPQRLSQSQVNSRQSLPKDLPSFYGHPEQWPIFLSTFEWSTKACAFNDAENLVRLQNALKGEALRSVQHMLIHPSNVQGVMEVLRMLFGQPEKILNSIKDRIKMAQKINDNNLKTLTSFAIDVRSLVSTINACNLLDEINNSSLLLEITQKLSPFYQIQWANKRAQLLRENKKPNLYEFDKWFFDIGITASSITVDHSSYKHNKERTSNTTTSTNKKEHIYSHIERKCLVCGDSNNKNCKSIQNCATYLAMNRGEKWNVIRRHKLCKFCLSKHTGDCKRKKECGIEGCKFFHHTSLHRYLGSDDLQMPKRDTNDKSVTKNDVIVNNTHNAQMDQILFKIIPIKIYGKNKTVNAFAFIDEGSSVSLVDESLVKELNLSGVSSPLCLRWTGGVERNEKGSKKVRVCISGGNKQPVIINAFTVKSLNLPTQSLDYKMMSQRYKHLRNLPVDSYTNAVPQILIGLNHFNLGVSTKVHEGTPQEPIAVHTKLGWLIYGASTEENKSSKNFNFHICDCLMEDNKLEQLVKSFYAIESVGISVKDPLLADKDKRALDLLKQFTKQKPNGHYEVPLLWKYDYIDMPDSYQMAFKRLVCLEKKLNQNNDHLNLFKETISKYLAKGYIRKLGTNEINNDSTNKKIWYLPIFSVFNKNKPGKHRIVWDAAAKSNGVSLNSYLLKGPDLISSLPSILYKFRSKSVAVCGDIEEMFHQVHIRTEDQDVQRFLWRDCIDSKRPDVYIMEVMIFGATCAPSISQYIKNLNADNYKDKFPQASKSIQENHYVDDLLDSVDSSEEAIKLISDVSYIHKRAGFKIRNWVSNEKIVQQSTPLSKTESAKCLNIGEAKQIEKVLGIFWQHEEDIITFKIATWLSENCILALDKIPTKREVLRLVMSIYDPLGLIGHIIMYVKILMQNIWRFKIDWDEQIPAELSVKWNKWVKALPDIENLKIPRCYLRHFPNYDDIEIQLHTFVDASRDGYAAVSYIRLKKGSDIICSIIGSKTRVAPIRITSVPRLELMAALIGARLAKYITDNHNFKINEQFFWCDSKTVLSWLNSDHRKYSQFVAFRVTEILEFSSIKEWRWIPSKQNVADEATKWTKFPEISNSCRWFQGPEFLTCLETEWPQVVAIPNLINDERVHHSLKITKADMIVDAQRFSKWYRLLRTVAYFLRFINKCRKIRNNKSELTQEELQEAENLLYKQAQSEVYFHEISQLKSNLEIPKSSDIYTKNPYLEKGILRVYGRIDNADISTEQKRPIILPRSSYITKLILMCYHEKFHHMNHETVINEVRQKFCISKLRAAFKSVIRTCQMCKVKKAIPQNPQMGILPRARVASYVAPFTYTGVDFFGPIFVTVNRHKEKRYGCLFTCLTIRAVHIEVTHSLTTSSCILAIRNFMARRGIPHEFYSDNGTNFIGAERELREALAEVDKNKLIKTFTSTTTKWNFNPPASPHMGGAWERLVRSIKTILYRIITSRSHGDEVLVSMLLEIENIINSRPLAYVPINGENEEALTPNHFLIGSSSGMKPMTICDDSGLILKQSWLTSQQYANVFWKKWLLEYLPSLTCRSKWHARPKPLSQGDLVIIVDPSLPRNVWLRGKVLETRLASDGQVRSAKVLTKQGIVERPATKLAILDVARQVESGFEGGSSHTAGGMLTLHPKS